MLDVMMDGLDGMELAAALRKLGNSTAIIFISSNREMALRGYEVSAARYLAKPLREDQLREALLYCYKTFCENKELLLPTEKGQSKLAPSGIIYAEPWERGSRLQLTSGPIETSVRISKLASMLPERSFTLKRPSERRTASGRGSPPPGASIVSSSSPPGTFLIIAYHPKRGAVNRLECPLERVFRPLAQNLLSISKIFAMM